MRRRGDAKAIVAVGHEILLTAYRVLVTAPPYTGPTTLSRLTTGRLDPPSRQTPTRPRLPGHHRAPHRRSMTMVPASRTAILLAAADRPLSTTQPGGQSQVVVSARSTMPA